MKRKMILVAVALVCFTALNAQTNFNCMYVQYCSWNDEMQQYSNCIGGAENSAFEINKAETSITAIIQNVSTTYPVQGRQQKRKGMVVYTVKKDSGDIYYYIVDSRNKEVRILNKKEGKATLTIYSQNNSVSAN